MRLLKSITALLLVLSVGSAYAYETEWSDSKGKPEEGKNNAKFKLDGVIWAGYENNDHDQRGAPDAAGTKTTGFNMGRAYVNVRGDGTDGPLKGWGFRITGDANNGAADSFVKFAYINIPVASGVSLRFGQQHNPTVDGQAGFSSQEAWGHRYLDDAGRVSFEDLGLSSSTDRGLALLVKNDYFGFHGLLGNGSEANSTFNASGVVAQDSGNTTAFTSAASGLSNGNGSSYGLDFQALFHVKPTGKDKETELVFGAPIRLYNVTGIDESENQLTRAACGTGAGVTTCDGFETIYADAKAKRDMAYGLTVDFSQKFDSFKISVGGGQLIKVDRQGDVYKIDHYVLTGTAIDPTSFSSISKYYYQGEGDQKGKSNYAYIHAKIGQFGAFFRTTVGTSDVTSNLSNKATSTTALMRRQMGTRDPRGLLHQAALIDLADDNVLGNLDPLVFYQKSDEGKAKFRNNVYGVTWHANDRFRLSLGTSIIKGTDQHGLPVKQNDLERVPVFAADPHGANAFNGSASGSLSASLPTTTAFRNSLTSAGLASNALTVNDLIGKRKVDKQVFIRSEFVY